MWIDSNNFVTVDHLRPELFKTYEASTKFQCREL